MSRSSSFLLDTNRSSFSEQTDNDSIIPETERLDGDSIKVVIRFKGGEKLDPEAENFWDVTNNRIRPRIKASENAKDTFFNFDNVLIECN